MLRASEWCTYQAEDEIIREGELDDRFYIIVSGSVSVQDWTAEARKDGLYYIRQPQDDPTRDIGDSRLLAWPGCVPVS